METKPALKTTEFYIHAALQIFFLLDTLKIYDYLPPKWSALAQAILAAAYTISRGQAKSGVPYGGSIVTAASTETSTAISADVTPGEPTSTA